MYARISLFAIFVFAIKSIWCQGIYTEFGQNRVQYRQFEWKTSNKDNIDVLHYGNSDQLASITLSIAEKELRRMEKYLSYKFGGSMQLVIFHSLSDYRQSNIGYTNPQLNSGGYLRIPNDVGVIYFNGDYNYLSRQIKKAICDIILREMIYGGTLQDRFDRVRSPMLPVWFTEGLTEFLSQAWGAEQENLMRNALSLGKFKNFNTLTAAETVLAGHAIWLYLVENYGAESVSTVIFIARYTRSADAAIFFHTKKYMGEFLQEWRTFYEENTKPDNLQKLPKGKSNIPTRIAGIRHTAMALAPNGDKVAIVTNDIGRFDIWIYNFGGKKVKHIYKGGLKLLNQLPDYGFPKVQWNPNTGKLVILTFEKNKYKLLEYGNGAMRELPTPFASFSGINDFHFNKSGDKIVFSGVKGSASDIYEYSFSNKKIVQLTTDMFHDKDAIFMGDSIILFISNRSASSDSNSTFLNPGFNLFQLNKYSNVTSPLTNFTGATELSNIISYNTKEIGFLCDKSGLQNAYILHTDSGMRLFPQTNYMRNILAQEIDQTHRITAELLLVAGKYTIYTGGVPDNPIGESVSLPSLKWKNSIGNLDSLFNARNLRTTPNMQMGSDSVKQSIVDTSGTNYIYYTGFPKIDYELSSNKIGDSIPGNFANKRHPFINALQPEFLLSQSDNRILGSYMQNNQIYPNALRNAIVMPYLKVSLTDILRNYIVEAGLRSSLDLQITDFTTRFAILKYRFDHDLSVSRHSRKFEDANRVFYQNISTQLAYSLSLPLSERGRIMFTAGVRREFLTLKATEAATLNIPDRDAFFSTGKLEFVYDNSVSQGLNQQTGLRFKSGLDGLTNLNGGPVVLNYFVDARLYLPLYKRIILAIKASGVYAMGKGKVAYYLGAVENWTPKEQFIAKTKFLTGDEYLFQQWVCNLRGFSRGIRIGSSFALVNAEIRIPIMQMLRKKPLESEFFRNLTFIAFADAGTAFIGRTPSDPSNPFNTISTSTPNYTLDVTSHRNPWAIGVGYGVRTRVLGYFIKFDRGYGRVEKRWQTPVNYISLGFDF